MDKPSSRGTNQEYNRSVHLKGYGWVIVFKTVGRNGDDEYWATSDQQMSVEQAAEYALSAWQIEVYHQV